MIRVRISAVSAVTRAGLESLLEGYPQFRLLEEFAEEEDAEAQTDVLLAEEEDAGAEALSRLTERVVERPGNGTPVILLVRGTAANRADLFRSGARAVLPSHASGAQIAAAIEAVATGLGVFDASEMESFVQPHHLADGPPARLPEALTPRETEVLRAMAEGLANKEIAARLGISENTVKFHVASVMGKLGAASRTEAVMTGIRSGIVLI
jgi:NarL family two-component system response regulator YdfI